MLRSFQRFARDRRGNVAMIFALSIIPTIMLIGSAVDVANALRVRAQLGHAIDSAALAVGRAPGLTEQQYDELAQAFFDANYKGDDAMPIEVTATEQFVRIDVEAYAKTAIMHMFGNPEIRVERSVEVRREIRGLDLVMVLDNSGSMSGSKISALRDASRDMIDILYGDTYSQDKLNVGLVPFGETVNVGTGNRNASWMDLLGQSSVNFEDHYPQGMTRWEMFDELEDYYSNWGWNGCVEARPSPYDVTDETPSLSNPDTLFAPAFAPDEPDDSYGYRNSYIDDGLSRRQARRADDEDKQLNIDKYDRPSGRSSSSYRGPNWGCRVPPITDLTNDRNEIEDNIDDFIAVGGGTNIPQGIVWGLHMLSPSEPLTRGKSWENDDWDKAIVIMTDGENNLNPRSNWNKSDYTAYGFVADGRAGVTTASSSATQAALDGKTATLCDNLKAEDVVVYTIAFQVSDSSTRDMLEACASGSERYFNSSSSDALRDAFRQIGGELSELRIAK